MSHPRRGSGVALRERPEAPGDDFEAAGPPGSSSKAIEQRLDRIEAGLAEIRASLDALTEAVLSRGDCPAGISDRMELSDLAAEIVETLLHSRDLEKALGPEPTLQMRETSIEEMLAPRLLDKEAVEGLLESDPDMMETSAFAAFLAITPQALHQRRKKGQVIGLSQTKRKAWFPRSQLDGKRCILDGVEETLARFDGDAWAAHRFLAARHRDLDGATGYDALRAGRREAVLTSILSMREGAYE